jgi:hypothetical protein
VALLKFARFRQILEESRATRNAGHRDANGMTAFEKWLADPTPIEPISPASMLANLTVSGETRVVNKSGIRHRGVDYISVALSKYRKRELSVRYLPSVRDWIEVFDGNTYVGRAWRADTLSEAERNRILLERVRLETRARANDHMARQHRAHIAAAQEDLFSDEDPSDEVSMADALAGDDETPSRPSLPVVVGVRKRRRGPGKSGSTATGRERTKNAATTVAEVASTWDLNDLLNNERDAS